MSGRRVPAGFTLSGPDVDRTYPDGGGVALSAAITVASRHDGEATFYVRAPDGEPFGRVERDAHGHIEIYRQGGNR